MINKLINRDLFNFWNFNKIQPKNSLRSMHINFGPQHPASHGVLRIILQLQGENIQNIDTHIGLLHRGTEKLIESKPFLLGLPYFDRLDYTSILIQEHAYCLAIENLCNYNNYIALFSQIRLLFDELTRILNHLIALSTHSMDVGTMAIFFWAFEEREKIMEFYERTSGARMHAAFYRPNELNLNYITTNLLKDILIFCKEIFKKLVQIEAKLNYTTIWRNRLCNVGTLNSDYVYNWAASGVLARSINVNRDLRISKSETYSTYKFLNLRSFTGNNGDCYDRFLIRIREMSESTHLIIQVINEWLKNSNINYDILLTLKYRKQPNFRKQHMQSWYNGMEELINHFKYFSEGLIVPTGITYSAVESAKGEFGVLLIANQNNKPFRCYIRSPAFFHTQLFAPMTQGHFFADLITIIGSQDIVMGEVDK